MMPPLAPLYTCLIINTVHVHKAKTNAPVQTSQKSTTSARDDSTRSCIFIHHMPLQTAKTNASMQTSQKSTNSARDDSTRSAVHLPLSAPIRSKPAQWSEPEAASPQTLDHARKSGKNIHDIQREAWGRMFARPPTPLA
jgi:hypothetical protein